MKSFFLSSLLVLGLAISVQAQSIFYRDLSRVKPARGFTTPLTTQPTASTAVLVDVSLYKVFSVFNSTTFTTTILLDQNKSYVGMEVTVKRYNETQNGPISISSSAYAASQFIQSPDGTFNTTFSLPTTTGQRQATFVYTSQGYWEFLGY